MQKIGKYEIIRKIGQGGMGTVYMARDPLIDRVVAVKTISTQLDDAPHLRSRFHREAQSAGQLSHKNIITIYDLGEEGGEAYLAMEFLEGEDLRSTIFRRDEISLEVKLDYMAQVCEGLSHAHEKNVIHRDIKPGNIFVTSTGQIKILDFGLARMIASDITKPGQALGTPNYMSPEQVMGSEVDHRTDIFSCGVVFYELLTYRKPFEGESYPAIIFKILQEEPEPIDRLELGLSGELSVIVSRALAKAPAERYQTAAEMRRELLDLLWNLQGTTHTSLDRSRELARQTAAQTVPKSPVSAPSQHEAKTASFPSLKSGKRAPSSQASPTLHDGIEGTAPATGTHPSHPPRPRLTATHYLAGVGTLAGIGLVLYFALSRSDISAPVHENAAPISRADEPAAGTPEVSPEVQRGLKEARSLLDMQKYSEASEAAQSVLSLSADNPEARSIRQEASESIQKIDDGNRRARALSENGRYEEAMAVLAEVFKLSSSDADAQRLSAQLDRYARGGADEARKELQQIKAKAIEGRAQELASSSFKAAEDVESQGARLYSGRRYGQAAAKFFEARELYRHSESAARSELAARESAKRAADQERFREEQRSQAAAARQMYERERFRAVESGAENRASDRFREGTRLAAEAQAGWERGEFSSARRDYEAAAVALKQASEAAAKAADSSMQALQTELESARQALVVSKRGLTSTDSRAEAEETRAAELERQGKIAEAAAAYRVAAALHLAAGQTSRKGDSGRQAINRLVEQYKSAYAAKDIQTLLTLWPGMSESQQRAIREEFDIARTIQMDIQILDLTVAADAATVTGRRSLKMTTVDGSRLQSDLKAIFGLKMNAGSWFIETIRFEPVR